MNQFTQMFRRMTPRQMILLAAAAIAVIGGLTTFTHWNQERDFKPLFTGLAAEDAGPLLVKLRESGAEYRLADGGSTVMVSSGRVAELRLDMAAAGLPKSGRIGFELFDKANFGASEFAEQVNYHRAIEGELERSVMSIREVEQARVHLTMAKDSLYSESRQPAKASVLIKLRRAAGLSPQNVAAICQLTASAVPGLAADQVSLVDTSGNLLNRPRAGSEGADGTEATLDYRKSIERDLQNKISTTLEPLLGLNHFRAGVSVDVDLTSGEQSEETFDPQKSVMTSSQRTDDGSAAPAASGVPGTASNIPPVASKPAARASSSSRHTENVTYQTSRLVKHTRLPQGAIKKLSVSVLVDHAVRWDGPKRIVEPPSPEKLKVIRDVLAAATGLDTNRGDQIVVEAFPFESTLSPEPILSAPSPAAPVAPEFQVPAWARKIKPAVWGGIGGGVLIALIAAVWLLRRRSKANPAKAVASVEAAKVKALAPTPEAIQTQLEGRMAEQAAERARLEAEALMSLKFPAVGTKKTEVLTKHIATEVQKESAAMAQVVRTWLNG
jgi:flagellar M-ring protein FliF